MAARINTPGRPNEKYDLILRAAIKVFAKNGFFNSKVADVARAAGVADGTVYLYFKNKDDILISIFNDTMTRVLTELKNDLAEISDQREQLRHVAVSHLGRMTRDRNLAIVFQVELRQSTKFMEQFSATKVAEYFDLIGNIISKGQANGLFRSQLNPKIVTKVFFGALDEMATNWILSRKKYDLVAIAEPILDLFFNGVAA